ncbi:MAG: transcriptional regulator, MarR family [Gemmatimonadetes bacterium]|nr:transcriptional regulator, MarR family [Gemmatimonadota bacterium]
MDGKLQSQLKQSRPFRSSEEQLFLNLLRTARQFLDDFDRLLRGHELTQPQYNILRILRGAGAAGLPSGEIGERMVGRDPDVTRLLDRMEERELVSRRRSTTDRRVVTTQLTASGLRLVNDLDAPIAAMHVQQFGHLSEDEMADLNLLLERARDEDRR